MAFENVTINFDEYVNFFIKKWKLVIVIILTFVIMFTGATRIFGNEISVPHSEEYLYYEKSLKWHEEYLKDSILMSANPTSIYVGTILLKNIADKDVLKNYVTSVDIWDELETERVKKYYPELVNWEQSAVTETVEISVRHATEAECRAAIDYMMKKVGSFDPGIEIIKGASRVEIDKELEEEQLRWYDRIEYTNTLLLEAQAGYTIRINLLAAAATGGIAGAFAATILTLIMYLFKRNKVD